MSRRGTFLHAAPDLGIHETAVRTKFNEPHQQPAAPAPAPARNVVERPWLAFEVTCPDCGSGYNTPCKSPAGPHRARFELAKEYTRRGKPHP